MITGFSQGCFFAAGELRSRLKSAEDSTFCYDLSADEDMVMGAAFPIHSSHIYEKRWVTYLWSQLMIHKVTIFVMLLISSPSLAKL